jgi:hypothetical protein
MIFPAKNIAFSTRSTACDYVRNYCLLIGGRHDERTKAVSTTATMMTALLHTRVNGILHYILVRAYKRIGRGTY